MHILQQGFHWFCVGQCYSFIRFGQSTSFYRLRFLLLSFFMVLMILGPFVGFKEIKNIEIYWDSKIYSYLSNFFILNQERFTCGF